MTPAELLASADPIERERGRLTIKSRVRLGWSPERAASEEIGAVGRPRTRRRYSTREGDGLRDIAEALGLSRERVRQIEVEALRKLRAEFERLGWTADEVGAWLDAKARGADEPVSGDTAPSYLRREERETLPEELVKERRARDERRLDREADAMAREIVEVARAHRFVERVVSGMEDGGEIRMLEER